MRIGKLIILLAVAALSCRSVQAQDPQSLGDVARQTRQQKQQQEKQVARSKETPTPDAVDPKPSKTPHVVTNDEIPEHTGPSAGPQKHGEEHVLPNYKEGKLPPERWRALILQQKSSIATLQRRIDSLTSSIRFAGGNYDIHEVWNERQRQKVKEVDSMKSELEQLQKQLEDLQETARRQGYGSSVYDP